MLKRVLCTLFAAAVWLSVLSGCAAEIDDQSGSPSFTTYSDIPGVTSADVEAIEALKSEYGYFVYGMPVSTEAFTDKSGEFRGFAALFCEWLSGLFGVRFEPVHYEWSDLLVALESGEVDFTGEMRATDERLKTYLMTDTIAERILRSYHLAGTSITEISKSRPIRYALIEGSAGTVLNYLEPGTYEISYIAHIDQVHEKILSGEIDAFLHSNSVEENFIAFTDIIADDFFPMINSPVSLATQDARLEPIISAVQKALQADGVWTYLTELYKAGYAEYVRHAYLTHLTEDELAYIRDNPVVYFAAETNRYPISFYNAHSGEWQGIAIDTLKELEFLTGISFRVANARNATWSEMLEMLEGGEVAFITELIPYVERVGHYLWTENVVMTDYYALLSKSDYPNLRVNEVIHSKVGLLRDTAYTEMFKLWFPFHPNTVDFYSLDDAIDALDNNVIDLIMASESRLLYLTHYLERPDFSINIVFDTTFPSTFGFNINEGVLCSIVDKAMSQINEEIITRQWMSRTYDYRTKMMEAQRPWLFGAIGLAACVIALTLALFFRVLREEHRLEMVVLQRTGELILKTNQLEAQTVRLVEAEQEARSASETKSRFIANMSHEMRTPMNALIGLTELTLEDTGIPSSVEDNLRKIGAAGRVLLRLIGNVLDISKIESGKFQLTPTQYDVSSLLNDVITLNTIGAEGKPITFQLDIEDDLPRALYGDDLRVRQILNNLLSNAFKYTRKGNVTLGLRCERGDGDDVWLSLYVSDTGIGIRAKDVKKLFSDYNQVDARANREVDGTGLGLSITKRLVEQMGGEISVESAYGEGSTFRARIRQAAAGGATIGRERAEALRTFHYENSSKPQFERLVRPDLGYANVLLVDDFPTNLEVAAGMLRKYKMHVDCVLNGQEAVDRIDAGEPVYDAVFMDHMMPEMDGMEAVKQIRAIGTEYSKAIPIIALTANAAFGNEQLFLDNGFQAFLPKPINTMSLDAIVQKWVRDKSREPGGGG